MMEDLPTIPEWVEDALCARVSAELFFPPTGSSGREAKSICRTCPVRRPCRELALSDPKLDGVWGGTTVNDRKAIRMKRGAVA